MNAEREHYKQTLEIARVFYDAGVPDDPSELEKMVTAAVSWAVAARLVRSFQHVADVGGEPDE